MPRHSLEKQARAVALIAFVSTVIFLSWPELDLTVARLLFRDSAFIWQHSLVARWVSNVVVPALGLGLVLVPLLITLWRRYQGQPPQWRCACLPLLVVLLGSGVMVNLVFKDNWDRARPRQISDFGGTAAFTPPILPADQCVRNCSFVSGDASIGFAFVVLALMGFSWGLPLGLALGAALGFMRMAQGAHFLSDVVFAGLVIYAVALVLAAWLQPRDT